MSRKITLGFMILTLSGCSFVEKKETELQIKTTVYEHNDKLSYCYKKALEENNELEGEMDLQWDVSYQTGQEKVKNIQITKTNIRSETLANCMKQAVSTMRFNLDERNERKIHRVSYPFVFKNDKSQALKR